MLWVKHAPCLQVCFDEASPDEKRSARFCRSNNFILLLVVFLPLTEQMAQPCQVFIHRDTLWHWALCGMWHSTHREGKDKAGCCGKRSPPASPELPTTGTASAQPVPSPSQERRLPTPLLFPGAGQSLLPTVFYHTKTLWHSSCDRKGVVGR